MQGAINTIEGVRRWFEATEAPFFTLAYYSTSSPTGMGNAILKNAKFSDMETAWRMLRQAIEDQTGAGRAQLHLIVATEANKMNLPAGRTNIDIVGGSMMSMPGQMASIGSLPSGYLDEARVQTMLNEREEKWKLERENEDLRAQLDNPGDWAEKAISGIERIASTPLGMALVSKILGGNAMPQVPINGMPTAQPDDDDEAPSDFDQNIEATAKILGVSDEVLAQKIRQMVESNPDLAKSLLQ